MRLTLLPAAVLACATLAHAASEPPTPVPTPILVELFTSEGCSSCPPADALLARLAHEQPIPNTQIIVLGEHVDYWDRLGWQDRFSSAQLTERQNQYSLRFHLDSVYTPQMVVDGTTQFVGNNQTLAWRAVSAAAQTPKPSLTLTTPSLDRHRLAATVSSTAPLPPADLYAALVEPVATTEVRHGENTGRRLQHVAVVRSLTRIGSTQQLARGPIAFTLPTPDLKQEAATLQVVVFAQQPTLTAGLGPILAAVLSPTVPTTQQTAAHPVVPSPWH